MDPELVLTSQQKKTRFHKHLKKAGQNNLPNTDQATEGKPKLLDTLVIDKKPSETENHVYKNKAKPTALSRFREKMDLTSTSLKATSQFSDFDMPAMDGNAGTCFNN